MNNHKRTIIKNKKPYPWITAILFITNTVTFVIVTLLALSDHAYSNFWEWFLIHPAQQALTEMGALVPGNSVWEQPWRLLCCSFLHIGFIHYGVNMQSLIELRQVERVYGKTRFLVLFLVGGAASSLGAMITFVLFPATPLIAGASGSLYALLAADFMHYKKSRTFSKHTWLIAALLFLPPMLIGNPFAHISGALTGGFLAWFFLKNTEPTSPME